MIYLLIIYCSVIASLHYQFESDNTMSTSFLLYENRLHLKQQLALTSNDQKSEKESLDNLNVFVQQDDIKEKKIRNPPTLNVLDPDGKYMIAWRMINLICICIYLFELPIALVFEHTRKDRQGVGYLFQIINIPCIVIFTLNMVVKMKLPYYKDGILITDAKDIYKHYFKFMFILDIISITIIIINQISQNTGESDEFKSTISKLDLLFYVKIVQVFEINNLNRNKFQLHRKILAMYNVIVLYTSILLISNIMACTFFAISKSSCFDPVVSPDNSSCWLIQTITGGKRIIDHAWYVQYIYSLYWASTTMLGVGYGDIHPYNSYEVAFTIFAEYIACGIFAYSINEVWQIFTQMRQKQTKHQKQFNIINRYMRDRQVKSIVSNKVKAYLTHYYRYQKKGDKDKQMQIIDDLAPAIKEELLMDTYGKIFKFKMFEKFSQQLFQSLIFKIEQMRYPDGQTIQSPEFQQTDPFIGYLFRGSLNTHIQIGSKSKQINSIQKQHIFGQYEFITNQITDNVVTTNSYCSIYMLRNSNFVQNLQDKDFQQYYKMKHSILQLNKLKCLNIQCYFCGSESHISQNCCMKKIKENIHNIIKSYRTTINLQDHKFKRVNRKLIVCLKSKNQITAQVRMFMSKQEEKARKRAIGSLNQSLQQVQLKTGQSYNQMSARLPTIKESPRQKSQFYAFEKFGQKTKQKLARSNSLNNQFQFRKPKRAEYMISHLPVRQVLIIQSTVIDMKQQYDYYYKQSNINQIVKRIQQRKGIKQRRY